MTSPATDPRAARSREAILAAAYDLLAREGPGAITHQRVAQQAGVGSATVYRHLAAPEDLLRDVIFSAELPFFATDAPRAGAAEPRRICASPRLARPPRGPPRAPPAAPRPTARPSRGPPPPPAPGAPPARPRPRTHPGPPPARPHPRRLTSRFDRVS